MSYYLVIRVLYFFKKTALYNLNTFLDNPYGDVRVEKRRNKKNLSRMISPLPPRDSKEEEVITSSYPQRTRARTPFGL